MRILIFLILTVLASVPAQSQVPSKKEMQEQMQQVIKELNSQIADLEKQIADAKKNKEDESVIKDLQDQLAMLKKQVGLMGGLNKNISNVSDKTFKTAVEEENTEGVPKRDDARINALPKKILTGAELNVFVQKIFTAIDNRISLSQKKNATDLYNEINGKSKSPKASGNVAVLCWLAGSTDMAIWIMGKSCMDDMSNTDNLNNYASFLTMVGGEHLAIPILKNLNQRFPGNSTILNNLGQAWYGLGNMAAAGNHLDSANGRAAGHPHANETKSKIDESQGREEESIEDLKKSPANNNMVTGMPMQQSNDLNLSC